MIFAFSERPGGENLIAWPYVQVCVLGPAQFTAVRADIPEHLQGALNTRTCVLIATSGTAFVEITTPDVGATALFGWQSNVLTGGLADRCNTIYRTLVLGHAAGQSGPRKVRTWLIVIQNICATRLERSVTRCLHTEDNTSPLEEVAPMHDSPVEDRYGVDD